MTNDNDQRVGQATVPSRYTSLRCFSISILISIVVCSAASIFFYNRFISLKSEVESNHVIISLLQKDIADEKLIIARFDESVTNADVEKKLASLEVSLAATQANLLTRLRATETSIGALLNDTVLKLDNTVKAAEQNIHDEVALVETNIDKYKRTTQDQFSMENSFMIWQLAGTFTVLACLISMWHLTAHLRSFRRPFVQRKVLAILWMSPIYGITSWFSLVFPKFEGYLSILKDFYEAYVIYQFLSFLISVVGAGDRQIVVEVLSKNTEHLDPPMQMFGWCRKKIEFETPTEMANAVLFQCQVFAMQFVLFKPLTSISLFVCNSFKYYGGFGATSSADYRSPQFWLNIVQNVSIFFAFTGLLKFYHALGNEISWCRPFPKFLCIKGIVFMTFWQGLVISFLAKATESRSSSPEDDNVSELWATQAQNFMICLEMLLFSIAHFYCFPVDEWHPDHDRNKKAVGDKMAFGDFVKDLKLIMRGDNKAKEENSTKNKHFPRKKPKDSYGTTKEATAEDVCVDGKCEEIDDDAVNIDLDMNNFSTSFSKSLVSSDAEVREAANRVISKSRMHVISHIQESDLEADQEAEKLENAFLSNVVLDDAENTDDIQNERTGLLGGNAC
eukprot:CAMPEP_0194290158 /NCGR_PEP_ID=MMETSP0169-20130528/40663_1 /TAXON_ID=218684 /ORGANISM="Corethron pennatum, Strain L29A3" /LENGTH=618 /DNA_ID=CAMNT_0039037681 /DNA_START=15 /DNA_END=1871 /DNA_ORIENTATION=-